MQTMTSKVGAFVRSLALLVAFVVVLPWLLIAAAHARFDGPAPWSSMPGPSSWDAVGSALTDRLSETTIADVVIRIGLMIAWVAIGVVLVTVVLEVVHMVRHAGLPMPDVRGLALTQHMARVIATGLLVVVPMLSSPSKAIAQDSPLLAPNDRPTAALDHETARPENVWIDSARRASTDRATASPAPAGFAGAADLDDSAAAESPERMEATGSASTVSIEEYIVRPGDSIYSIAARQAGPDQRSIAEYADQLLDLNLDRQMSDGQWFTNAAYIDVGWTLQLPPGAATSEISDPSVTSPVEVVDRGESLWSIAEDRLGDGTRWPEIYELNEGRSFSDGRELIDPDLIHPGWELDMPSDRAAAAEAGAAPDVAEPVGAPEVSEPAAPDTEAEPAAAAEQAPSAEDHTAATDPAARPENAWVQSSAVVPDTEGDSATGFAARPAAVDDVGGTPDAADMVDPAANADVTDGADDVGGVELLTFERAAMLSAGVLALLAVRRRTSMRRARPNSQLREPAPASVATERALRSIDGGDRFARVDISVRSAALGLVDQQQRVTAVAIDSDGDLELYASGAVELAPPWEPVATAGDRARWRLPASTPIELLVDDARRVGAPCPTLVQLGRDVDGRDVYVDLEAFEAIEVGGPGDHADAIVAAVAATLAASVLAEVTTLVGVGVSDEAFLHHRHHRPVRDIQQAFEEAADAIGSTGLAERSTFELRALATSGEAWEPAVVLAGSAVGTVSPPGNRTGLAVVSASPIHGPSSRLAPDGDAWTLLPLGLRLVPVGLSDRDVSAIAQLAAVPEPTVVPAVGSARVSIEPAAIDADVTLLGGRDDERSGEQLDDGGLGGDESGERLDDGEVGAAAEVAAPSDGEIDPLPYSLVVRLLGPVSVESTDGRAVDFERSKTKELVAWLATHRDRATRSNARAALWELDVRDSTFANVVSEARRALARLVEPPEGDEWVGRTMTDALPLHPLVVTDLDLIERALEIARLQPPNLAIATLAPAVEWVTGVPFEGTAYLWPDAEGITSDLVLRAITVTNALAAHCLSVGDIEGVFAATGRGLQVLPAHEDMIAVRMRAYAHVGDRAGVRHEWETYERAIVADPWSDGEPSDRMLELRRELLSG